MDGSARVTVFGSCAPDMVEHSEPFSGAGRQSRRGQRKSFRLKHCNIEVVCQHEIRARMMASGPFVRSYLAGVDQNSSQSSSLLAATGLDFRAAPPEPVVRIAIALLGAGAFARA